MESINKENKRKILVNNADASVVAARTVKNTETSVAATSKPAVVVVVVVTVEP